MNLGDFLKKQRLKNFLNQKQMAEKLGITSIYYCMLEKNKRKPGLATISKICEISDVKPAFIGRLLKNENNK